MWSPTRRRLERIAEEVLTVGKFRFFSAVCPARADTVGNKSVLSTTALLIIHEVHVCGFHPFFDHAQ